MIEFKVPNLDISIFVVKVNEEKFCEENEIDYYSDRFIELTDREMSKYQYYFKVIL